MALITLRLHTSCKEVANKMGSTGDIFYVTAIIFY